MEEEQSNSTGELKVLGWFFLAILVIGLFFYFGKIRPDNIRQECRDKAIAGGAKVTPAPSADTTTITSFNTDLKSWTQRITYQKCLNEKGVSE